MTAINIRQKLYDRIVQLGLNPVVFVNNAVEKELQAIENTKDKKGEVQ
jgi:hypothetical protein